MNTLSQKTALTIAGFDPSSGAGITADLQVFAAHGIFGTSAITALTVQSTVGVRRVQPVDASLLQETLATLHDDVPPHGIKIGMLGGLEQVEAVTQYLRSLEGNGPVVVLDPVIRSSSGALLLEEAGLHMLQAELLPLVDVITPNVGELLLLAGISAESDTSIQAEAEKLSAIHDIAVVVTGGDRVKPDDFVFVDGQWTLLAGEHIATTATHGTGCAFSSALLCGMLQGHSVVEAARAAKAYVARAMRTATPHGAGKGPMNLLWPVSLQE
ncbi:MAG: bifunctional hydroxymethylpyrimidine kinase/phosphomethylpyrimidine kinase [Terriglobus sp.]